MKKKLTRLFSVLLAAVLVFGTLPVAGAVDESGGNATETENAVTTVRVALNGTKMVTVDGDVTQNVGTPTVEGIATVETETSQTEPGTKYTPVTTTLEAGTYYVSATENDSEPTTEVNIEKSDDGGSYWVKSGGNYYYPTATYSSNWWNYGWSDYKATKTSTKTSSPVNINASGNGFIISKEVSKNSNTTTSYLTISSNGTISGSKSEANVYFYKAEEVPSKTQTKITFNGNTVGETTVTIGDVTYKIVVVPEDVANATGLTVEFWITNQKVTANSSTSMTISAVDAYDKDGVAIESLVPPTSDNKNNVFWKATRLTSGYKQEEWREDRTTSGTDFTKVRYYDGKWSFYDETTKSWKDITTSSSSYSSDSKDQIVAYYMQVTDVTKEVQTQVVDWGDTWSANYGGLSQDSAQFVVLDFAVHYDGSGVTSPNTFPVADKTVVYHCKHSDNKGAVSKDENGNYYRNIGEIRAVNNLPEDFEVYMITLTPSSDDLTKYVADSSSDIGSAGTYSYGGTTQVVWAESETAVPEDFKDKTSDSTKYGNSATVSGLKIYDKHAMLVTYYVREKVKDSSLHVYYVNGTKADKNDGTKIFHSGVINVKGNTTFKTGIALDQTNWKGKLVNSEVTNSAGNTQYITADLSEFYDVPASLRNVEYTCNDVETSDDLKTVWLYYSFGTDVSFVADFGTPMVIEPTDLNADLGTVKTVTITTNPTYGTATVNAGTNNLTYTPSQSFAASANGDSFMVTVGTKKKDENGKDTDETESVSYNVHIYPASNVLYEEGFLSNNQDTEDSTNEWELTAATASTQETQKTSDTDKSVFGYDGSYKSSINANGVWKAGSLAVNTPTKPLTTTFYGNTFDLIGTCGYHTGKVIMLIKTAEGAESSKAKIVVVDTRYNDGSGEQSAKLYQVPLAHVDMGADATYDVKIYASGLAATTAGDDTDSVTAKTVLAASADDSYDVDSDEIAAILEENGLTIDQVEVVTTSAMTEIAAADSEQIAVASLPDGERTAVAHGVGNYVEIDGFRVYRSTASDDAVAKNYPAAEQNVTYYNILDIGDGTGTIVAYSEAAGKLTTKVEKYEAEGGPQNEIYLATGQAIYFKNAALADKTIQISLRAVNLSATASVTESKNGIALATNTEMYYMVTADAEGQVVIANNGDGILAIGNVKMPAEYENESTELASEQNSSAVNKAVQAALNGGEMEVFTPKTFTAKTTATTVIRNKVVTLKVNVSSDVAYITVNGVKYTRTGLTGLFRNTRTIRVVNTVKKDQTKTYEIVAYNADGVASETVTVTG